MSISIGSLRAADGPQNSQHTVRAASMPGDVSAIPGKAEMRAKAGEADPPSVKQVQQSLEDINKVLTGFSISVQFQIDPDYKELIVKVVDQDTGKLIRQIPTEEVVKMSKAMDNLKGLLFAQSV